MGEAQQQRAMGALTFCMQFQIIFYRPFIYRVSAQISTDFLYSTVAYHLMIGAFLKTMKCVRVV